MRTFLYLSLVLNLILVGVLGSMLLGAHAQKGSIVSFYNEIPIFSDQEKQVIHAAIQTLVVEDLLPIDHFISGVEVSDNEFIVEFKALWHLKSHMVQGENFAMVGIDGCQSFYFSSNFELVSHEICG